MWLVATVLDCTGLGREQNLLMEFICIVKSEQGFDLTIR